MDRIRRAELQELVEWKQGPCVSLFMPMHVKDRNAMEDPVRLRELVAEAQKGLEDSAMRRRSPPGGSPAGPGWACCSCSAAVAAVDRRMRRSPAP